MQNIDAVNSDYIEEKPRVNYLSNGFTLKSWLLTKDHKRIAIMYLIGVSVFFFLGGLYAATIRL
jgi:cytochrome c oxidase subunit 1